MTERTLSVLVSASRSPAGVSNAAPLTIEELEAGLRMFDSDAFEPTAFWDENVEAFRQTVLVALRETSEALLWLPMPEHVRSELELQLPELRRYIELADAYAAKRAGYGGDSVLMH